MKRLLPALKILITLTLLILVFRSVDLEKIRGNLAQLETGRVLILLLAYWAAQMVSTQRWRLFAASLGMQGSYFTFLQVYFVGMFFNIGLPSLVGGDVIKAYIITRRDGLGFRYGLTSVLQDRLAGLLVLLLYGAAAVILHPLAWREIPLWLGYFLGWLGIGVILWLVWRGGGTSRARRVSNRTTARKVLVRLAEFHDVFKQVRLSRGGILQVILLSLINSGIVIWVVHQLCAAAAHPVDFLAIAVLVPLIEVVTMVPITLAGLGIREWAYVEALAILGISSEGALTVALSLSALMIVRNLAGGLFLAAVPKSLRSKKGLENAIKAEQGGASE
jgi:uncharacterized protein (TIRG00374 family)